MTSSQGCAGCRNTDAFPLAFTMAFHPILDLNANAVWGYEALVRGIAGESAGAVLSNVTEDNRYAFDQACRVKAIELAGEKMPAGSDAKLSINFMPNAVYEPSACIRSSLAAAKRVGFDPRRLMFEFTENEHMSDTSHVERVIAEYKRMGFATALDDFGAGYAGLSLLAQFQPDIIKIDMELIRDIEASPARQSIVRGVLAIARDLDITVIAEGIETEAELGILRDAGVRLFQGFLFARPEVETFRAPFEIEHLAA
jgi:EAL domain-containing protein (putative c-di-GMP-specific phosphodiesterase class I)